MAGRAPDVGVGDAFKVGHVRDADDAADHDRARKAQHVRQQLAQERLLRHLAGCHTTWRHHLVMLSSFSKSKTR